MNEHSAQRTHMYYILIQKTRLPLNSKEWKRVQINEIKKQLLLEKYFQITTKKTQNDTKTIKQDYICKEELNLSWHKDELCASDKNTLLAMESMPKSNSLLTDDSTSAYCNPVKKKNILSNENFCKIHSLSSGKHEKDYTLFNSVVMIEKLPEQLINKSFLDKESSAQKIRSISNDSNDESFFMSEKLPEQSTNKSSVNTENSKPKRKSTVNDRSDGTANLMTRFCEKCKKIVRSNLKRTSSCPKCKCVLAYECKKCSKHAISYTGMLYHLRSTCQSEGNYYQCPGCPYKSAFKNRIKEHMQKLHKSLPISDMKIIATQDLQKEPKNSELYLHKCLKCGKQFKHLHYMKNHSRACGDFKYQVVGNGTNGNSNLENQLNQPDLTPDTLDVIKWAKLYCKKCDKRSNLKDSVHSFKKCNDCKTALLFECSKCEKQYESSNGIVYHMKVKCAAREMYYCSKCDYKNPAKRFLTAHYRNIHESSTVECPKCKSELKNKGVLVKHLEYCGKEPYLYCDECSYKSNNPTTFRTHMKRHNYNDKIAEASCSKCGKKMKNKFSLTCHLNYCGKEPRFRCNMCTYKSHYRRNLRNHMISMHFKNVNKHPACPKCGAQFDNKHCANAHLRFCGTSKSHFQCDYCPYKSDRKDQLKSHIMRKHLQNNDKSDESDVDIVVN